MNKRLKITLFIIFILLALCGLLWLYLTGQFLPAWEVFADKSEAYSWSDGQATGQLVLTDKRLKLLQEDQVLWTSPDQVLVADFLTVDLDQDKKTEVVLVCWSRNPYGTYKPFWEKVTAWRFYQHIYIYEYDPLENSLKPQWMSSKLANYVKDVQVDAQDNLLITSPGGKTSTWTWLSWGLEEVEVGLEKEALSLPTIKINQGPESSANQVTLVVNGDHLIHNIVYISAKDQQTGSYDFKPIYEETSPITRAADLAIGNLEGTICPSLPLSGYPLFNAPPELAEALRDAGYDLMCLANNHIADSGGEGLRSTVDQLQAEGIDYFGLHDPGRDFILVKEVKGIKFAFLAYSYGFNGMDAGLTSLDRAKLSWLDPVKIKADLEEARAISDVVVVMAHMGVEYQLQPTEDQIDLYHNMVEWGADLVLGNHPHVLQPIEIYQDKFIIYSLGNFISNQRVESGLDEWTERGVILEFTFAKQDDSKVVLLGYKPHPTWVRRTEKGLVDQDGYTLYDYRVVLAENYPEDPKMLELSEEVVRHLASSVRE